MDNLKEHHKGIHTNKKIFELDYWKDIPNRFFESKSEDELSELLTQHNQFT
jgi:hypothetical protein